MWRYQYSRHRTGTPSNTHFRCGLYGPLRSPMSRCRTMMRTSALLVGLVLASGCGGADSATAPEPVSDPPRPTTIAVSPFATELTALGATVQLAAEVRDQNARVMPTATVRWSSSDTSVAMVDQAGLVTAVSTGTAAITATAGPASASVGITVTAAALSDRDILVALYQATDGPNWNNGENWLTDAPLGEWYGVKTAGRGWVTELSLDENDLTGPIPPVLGHLTSMETLYLDENDLTGPIPSELGNLTSLVRLALSSNNLSGPIPPELGNLTSLEALSLPSNELTGPIPSELGTLRRLGWLSLANNNLSGPIPPELGNLTSVEGLLLSSNNLSGPIPPELGNLTSLEVTLNLSSNDLTGPIPPELGNLTSLEKMRFQRNNLSGMVPQSFLGLDKLNRFQFQENSGLCVPNTTAFRTWLLGIQDVSGPFCAASASTSNRPGPRRTYDGG